MNALGNIVPVSHTNKSLYKIAKYCIRDTNAEIIILRWHIHNIFLIFISYIRFWPPTVTCATNQVVLQCHKSCPMLSQSNITYTFDLGLNYIEPLYHSP